MNLKSDGAQRRAYGHDVWNEHIAMYLKRSFGTRVGVFLEQALFCHDRIFL